MDWDVNDVAIRDNPAAQQFEAEVHGQRALIQYQRVGDRLILPHTVVPAALGGHGLATKLVETALDYARVNDLKVVPRCSFVRTYLQRHPDQQSLVDPEFVPGLARISQANEQ